WRLTVLASASRRWPSHQRRRGLDFLCKLHIWSATRVSGSSPPCRRAPPTHGGGEKAPGSARGYRSHPGRVKRPQSTSLSTLDTPWHFRHPLRAVGCFFTCKSRRTGSSGSSRLSCRRAQRRVSAENGVQR